jgi:transposase InsO family protein
VAERAREVSERFSGVRFLIRDRDSKFTDSFDAVFEADGMQVITTPARAPRANAICERMVGTLRRECLDRVLVFGARQLEAILTDYLVHYNGHRPHRSLSQRPPAGTPVDHPPEPHRGVVRRDVLGGLIHEYEWAA